MSNDTSPPPPLPPLPLPPLPDPVPVDSDEIGRLSGSPGLLIFVL